MKRTRLIRSTALAAVLAFSWLGAVQAVEVAGVKLDDSAKVAGKDLKLNGVGVRTRAIFKVYAMGLYLQEKQGNAAAVLAAPGPKRLSMTFVREIEAGPFGKLLTRGVEDNVSKAEMSKLVPGLIRMGEIFTVNKVLQVGDKIYLDWIPGTGMVVTAKGKLQGEPFKEPEFYKAIMSIWFGTSPADWRLKDALLAVKS